ncbi:protein of unknown function [Tenacibaculum sp. 190130A14a]|uniref:Uncharacterized protein n=1 Tax=Tenacibaculum polynesiense TaxID=3137857 RepID=A0ABP1F1C5_9FLAO
MKRVSVIEGKKVYNYIVLSFSYEEIENYIENNSCLARKEIILRFLDEGFKDKYEIVVEISPNNFVIETIEIEPI